MGVRKLNMFLQEKCPSAIMKKTLFCLKNKKIVVDASNLLYRLNIDGELIQMLYHTIIVFKYYNIIPLFVFDGTPPNEKKEKLLERRKQRLDAQKRYDELMSEIKMNNISINDSLKLEIEQLERTKTQLSIQLIYEVKYLLKGCGIPYVDSVNEADELCAYLVNSGAAWACLSEDMDLIVYGCKRVIRYLSIFQHNCVIYEIDNILSILNISIDDFRSICVLCGNDYNKSDLSVYDVWKIVCNLDNIQEKIISNGLITDIDLFKRVIDSYEISTVGEKSEINGYNYNIEYKEEELELKKFVLEKNNFVFPIS